MTDLSDLQAQLESLKKAYYSGATKVSYDGKSVDYRDNKALLEAISSLEREIAGNTSPVNVVIRPRRW
jgi:hypothetical protein